VDLEAEAFAAIKPLYEDGERAVFVPAWTHDFGGVGGDDLAQGFAGEAAADQGGLGFRAIHDFPCFADGLAAGKFATKCGFESATAPDAFLVKRL
jgi:hypothetical protein